MRFQPLLELNDLERVRRRREDLRQQWVGINGDGRNQRIELVRRYFWRLLLSRARGLLGLHGKSVARNQQHRAKNGNAVSSDIRQKSATPITLCHGSSPSTARSA